MSTIRSRHIPVTRSLARMIGAVLVVGALAQPAPAGPNVLPLQVSTVPAPPANADMNPYGLALVPERFPGNTLHPGQLLVSNFNDPNNSQGMGTTIINIDPTTGKIGLFFQGIAPIGFTNALGVASAGFVFAGSVFTTDGTKNTATPGPLLVLDKNGGQVGMLAAAQKINGPWGLAINDQGVGAQLFVSNVFDGTITRLDVSFKHGVVKVMGTPLTIASGYKFGLDDTAIVVGPAGLAYDSRRDILYVAAEADNAIYALAGAGATKTDLGKGTLVFADSTRLAGPLGLILAPNGHLITANADPSSVTATTAGPSELVEFTPSGKFVRTFSIDSAAGSAFAIALVPSGDDITQFAYVDDGESTLSILPLAQ